MHRLRSLSKEAERRARNGIRRSLNRVGYDIVRADNPFSRQRALLGDAGAPMVFDVGASIGDVSAAYRAAFPSATIHAFEPQERPLRLLRRRFAKDSRIEVHQLALAERREIRTFAHNEKDVASSLLPTDARAGAFWDNDVETTATLEVQCDTLDAFCDERGIERIHVLKMDAQGLELSILQGAESLLARGAIDLVYTEMLNVPTYVGQALPHELMAHLHRHGFELVNLYGLRPRDGRLLQFDSLFRHSG